MSSQTNKPESVNIRRSATLGAMGGIAVAASIVVFVMFASWEWAVLLMLFAIYCAVMR